MLNRIIFIFIFCSGVISAQELPIENNCDTTSFYALLKESYLIENASCRMNGQAKTYYFTSYKEFSDYYNSSKYPLNTSCLPQFNNFNFKKYNLLLINYDYESSTTKFINVDVRYEEGKYLLLIKHFLNKNEVSIMMPGHYDKSISLPKEKSITKPIIYTCKIH